HDRGGHDVAAGARRFAINLHLPHPLDLQDDLLDLARIDLLARDVDQIAHAAGESYSAVAHLDQVVGDEFSRLERLEIRSIVQVAVRRGGAVHDEPAAAN